MEKYSKWIVVVLVVLLAAGAAVGFVNARKEAAIAGTNLSKPAAGAIASDEKVSGIPFPIVMGQLSQNMRVWSQLSNTEKKQVLNAVILLYRTRDNIAIMRDSDFYIDRIEDTLKQNPPVVGTDILTLVKILSVMEYDFFNGQNKDQLAREVLGEKGFAENQNRLRMLAQARAAQK